MSEEEVKVIARGLCQVLAYMHARGIPHRDIKPSNIMLDDNGMPILIDFGHAQSYDIKAGTESYYAPEQVVYKSLHKNLDVKKFDVWSLGQVIFECLDSSQSSVFKDKKTKSKMYHDRGHDIEVSTGTLSAARFVGRLLNPNNN